MYRVLYRKWRPQTFSDVIGQEHITSTLAHEIESGKVSHAYLFTGSRGTGKTTCAKIFAKAVNCPHTHNGNPCNECEICKGIDDGSILDVIEIDAASNNGVDNIRDLREEANYTPVHTKYRVYIIDEVHMLSIGAFNALLKTLEEPPEHVKFVLVRNSNVDTREQKLSANQRSHNPSDTIERLRQVDSALRLVRMSQYRSIRIRTRFQTGQSASYHKQRQNKEVETVNPASRYEHQSTDTKENQSRYHTPPVAPLPYNPSGRQRHQEVGTIDSSLRQGRHRLADMKRLLEMRIQHLQDAMGKAPHKEEAILMMRKGTRPGTQIPIESWAPEMIPS